MYIVPLVPLYEFLPCMQKSTSSGDQLRLNHTASTVQMVSVCFPRSVSQGRRYECVGYPALTNKQTGHADCINLFLHPVLNSSRGEWCFGVNAAAVTGFVKASVDVQMMFHFYVYLIA